MSPPWWWPRCDDCRCWLPQERWGMKLPYPESMNVRWYCARCEAKHREAA